jgi:hypothetical protein
MAAGVFHEATIAGHGTEVKPFDRKTASGPYPCFVQGSASFAAIVLNAKIIQHLSRRSV